MEYVIFDVETTDSVIAEASGSHPEIIEIGAVKINQALEIVDKYESLVCPKNLTLVTDSVRRITRLSQDELKDKKSWEDVWQEFAEFTEYGKLVLCCWGFTDFLILKNQYRRISRGFPHNNVCLDARSFVSVFCYLKAIKPTFSLGATCKLFSVDRIFPHRALPDSKDVVNVLKGMIGTLEDTDSGEIIEI